MTVAAAAVDRVMLLRHDLKVQADGALAQLEAAREVLGRPELLAWRARARWQAGARCLFL